VVVHEQGNRSEAVRRTDAASFARSDVDRGGGCRLAHGSRAESCAFVLGAATTARIRLPATATAVSFGLPTATGCIRLLAAIRGRTGRRTRVSGAPAFGRGPAPDGDYMPELNVLCGIAAFSTESEQHDAG